MIKSTAATRQTEESQCASVWLRADETACTWRSLSLALPREGAPHSCQPAATLNVFCLSVCLTLRLTDTCLGVPSFTLADLSRRPTPTPPLALPPFRTPSTPDRFPSGCSRALHPSFSNYLSSTPLSLPGCCLLLPLFPTCPFPTHPLLLLFPHLLSFLHVHTSFLCVQFLFFFFFSFFFFNLFSPQLSFKHESPCSSPQMKMLVMSMALRLEESETTLQDEPSGCDEA